MKSAPGETGSVAACCVSNKVDGRREWHRMKKKKEYILSEL
jgi:hypothetical protein